MIKIQNTKYIHTSCTCQVKSTKEEVELKYPSNQSSSSQSSSHSSTSSSSIKDVNQILYLLDRFGISDQFYHELSMLHQELPRSYEVKKARAAISSNVELRRLPRPYFGCYRPLKQFLIDAISAEVHKVIPKYIPHPETCIICRLMTSQHSLHR